MSINWIFCYFLIEIDILVKEHLLNILLISWVKFQLKLSNVIELFFSQASDNYKITFFMSLKLPLIDNYLNYKSATLT